MFRPDAQLGHVRVCLRPRVALGRFFAGVISFIFRLLLSEADEAAHVQDLRARFFLVFLLLVRRSFRLRLLLAGRGEVNFLDFFDFLCLV